MPGMDGLELLRTARERDPDLPVLLVSGTPTDGDAGRRAAGSGALLYLQKPVDLGLLRQAVDYAIQVRQAARRRAPEGAALAARFEAAMESLRIVHQPIVVSASRAVFGYEALVRSEEPSMGTPDKIFHAAEQLGRVRDLGRAIRARVAAAAARAPARAASFVNLHARDLGDEEIFSASAPLSRIASRVVLEISERASVDALDDVAPQLARLRALGFRIAIDDLGAGYAGPRHLRAAPAGGGQKKSSIRTLVRKGSTRTPGSAASLEALPPLCRENSA